MRQAAQRGFALLIVLWALVLITLVVTQLTAAGRRETQLAGNLRTQAQLEALADGQVHAAIFHLMDRSPDGWRADGRMRAQDLPGAQAEIRITDEAGKVNPSNATPELLQAVLRGVGVDTATAGALAAAIVVWRTPSGNREPGAPQFDVYRAAGRPFGPSGAPFLSMEELGAVIGMTPDVLDRLVPHLTLFTDGDPKPAFADPVVRQALAASNGGRLPGDMVDDGQNGVFAIAVTVSSGKDASFTRHAVVRLTRRDARQEYRIVAWDASIL